MYKSNTQNTFITGKELRNPIEPYTSMEPIGKRSAHKINDILKTTKSCI